MCSPIVALIIWPLKEYLRHFLHIINREFARDRIKVHFTFHLDAELSRSDIVLTNVNKPSPFEFNFGD